VKINDIKNALKGSTKEELIKTVVDLYKKNDFVKDYCISKFSESDGSELFAKHKGIIEDEFFPDVGDGGVRLSVAKKSITEFKKLSDDNTSIAELMLFYVEVGVNFTECYGDIDEPFYLSMERMFERTLKYMSKNNLLEMFNERCFKIVNDTVDMGWGFHDGLSDAYYSYYEDE
jgi:hypothetical protein